MGISFAPGLAQQLGGGGELDQLGEGIAHLINPNYKFQQAMRQAIATNPKLAQELADQEYTNPGFLKNMGLGPLGENIAKLPESPDASIIRTHREQILGIKGGQLDNETIKTKNEGTIEKGASDQLKNDPEALVDAARKAIGLGSMAQNREQKAKATQEEFQASVDKLVGPEIAANAEIGKYKNEITKAAIDQDYLDKVRRDLPMLQNVNLMQAVKDARAGKNVPLMQELLSTPQGANAWRAAETALASQETLNTRLMIDRQNNAARADRKTESEDIKQQNMAFQQWNKTGSGSPQAWLQASKDPNAVKVAQDKQASGAILTQSDWDLISVGEEQNNQREMAKASVDSRKALAAEREKKVASGANADMAKTATSIHALIRGNASPSEIMPAVGDLNQRLATRNKQTGRNIVANYGPNPEGRLFGLSHPTDLYYTENGKQVSDSDVNSYMQSTVIDKTKISTPQQTSSLSNEAKGWYDAYSKETDDAVKQREIGKLRSQYPAIYTELLAKGLVK